jgi:hypothetical protein
VLREKEMIKGNERKSMRSIFSEKVANLGFYNFSEILLIVKKVITKVI